jgi:hypothetical protein
MRNVRPTSRMDRTQKLSRRCKMALEGFYAQAVQSGSPRSERADAIGWFAESLASSAMLKSSFPQIHGFSLPDFGFRIA